MKREIECSKCGARDDQYWVKGKYRWLSKKNKSGTSVNCPSCQEGRWANTFSPLQCEKLAKIFA